MNREDIQQVINDREKYKAGVRQKSQTKSIDTSQTVIVGYKGSGKTLLQTILAYHFFKNKPFWSNFWLLPQAFPQVLDFNLPDFYKNPNVKGLFLDEAHTIANQFSSGSLTSQVLTGLLSQSRKHNQFICISTIEFNWLAKDIRLSTDYLVKPFIDLKRDRLYFSIWDVQTDLNNFKTFCVKNVSQYYKLYDTKFVVISTELENKIKKIVVKQTKINKEFDEVIGK